MGRFLAGSIAALLMVAAGLFWWQGEAERGARPLVAQGGVKAQVPSLPGEGDPNARGAPPPAPPQAEPRTREQKRFDRYDRNRDGIITRAEMLSTRSAAFRKLDKDGNNLLSFEEWAVRTSDRFAGADANRDGNWSPPNSRRPRPSRPPGDLRTARAKAIEAAFPSSSLSLLGEGEREAVEGCREAIIVAPFPLHHPSDGPPPQASWGGIFRGQAGIGLSASRFQPSSASRARSV